MTMRTSAKRSRNMRAIRSQGGRSTELRFRAVLMRRRVRGWRMGPSEILGTPDFYFDRLRIAVFVDGCFWHCCPTCGHVPKTNLDYWTRKLSRNRKRDRLVTARLRRAGVHVLRYWECELYKRPQAAVDKLMTRIVRVRRLR